jgi:hypothetical protein
MRITFLLFAKQLGGHEIMALNIARLLGCNSKHKVQVFFPVEMSESKRLRGEAENVELIPYRSGLAKNKNFFPLSFFLSLFWRFILMVRLKSSCDILINCQGGVEANWVINLFAWIVRLNYVCYVPFFFTPTEIDARWPRTRDFIFPFLVRFPRRYLVIHEFYRSL